MMSADTSDLRDFAADLGKAGDKVLPEVEKVVFKGAMNVKRGMQKEFEDSTHFKPVARSVDFDIDVYPNRVEAEIGPNPEHDKVGYLANIAYFGSSTGVYRGGPKWSQEVGRGPAKGGGTVDFERPFMDEIPRFEKAIAEVLRNVL